MQFEKYIPRRVVKDISPEAIAPGGERMLRPGDLIDAVNCRIYSSDGGGNKFVIENVKGNSLLYFPLPSGTNKCVGHFLYNKYNSIIFFLYNSNGNHQIVQWNFDTQAFTVILGPDSSLAFDPDVKINQGGILDDIMIWNEPMINPPRKINIARAKTGGYTAPYQEWVLTLISKPPLVKPTAVFASDSGFQFNYVSKDVWQFSYRFIYKDGDASVFSPLSLLMYWGTSLDITDLTNNVIDVTVTIPSELLPLLRTVEVAYRSGNIGNYFVFEQIQNPNQSSYTVRFRGIDTAIPVAPEDSLRLYDVIPPLVESLGLIKDRAFLSLNDLGFDVPETFTLTVSVGTETQDQTKRYLKQGGTYNVGIVFSDDYGRISFVKAKQSISVPYQGQAYQGANKFVQWTVGGNPPPGFTKYQIVMSLNNSQELYVQASVIPFLYVSDQPPNTNEGQVYDTYFIWRGYKFLKSEVSTTPLDPIFPSAPYQYIYLQMPLQMPFVIDKSCYIKILKTTGGLPLAIIPVLGVNGDFVIINPIYDTGGNLIDWTQFPNLVIEVFSPVKAEDNRFFEVGQQFDITGGNFSTGSGKIYGDAYFINQVQKSIYTPLVLLPTSYTPPQLTAQQTQYTPQIESPSGIYGSSFLSVDNASSQFNILRPNTKNPILLNTPVTVTPSSQVVYTLDYNKIASDWGRVHTENNNEVKQDQNTSIGFSDPFFQSTLTFGLNTFRAENKYDVPRDRSPIRAFKKANQILLAIHERNTSSLYIGEGLIRQNNDFVLAKTEAVIGDNRELEFNYGCINPESVIEVYGHVYWWDAYRGAVVRYTNAGLFAISNYGMKNFFYYKGRAYEPYRDQVKVLTGYDYLNDEFLISFPAVADIAAETWAFSPQENVWLPRYSYTPEWWASLNNNLFSFKNGGMWIHHKNALFNNFYGVQYQRSFDLVCNPELGKNKRLLNIHIKGQLTQNLTSEDQVVVILTKEGQVSFIPAYEFSLDEGKYVAPVLKDINTPGFEENPLSTLPILTTDSGDFTLTTDSGEVLATIDIPSFVGVGGRLALRSGDDMVSNHFIIRVINNRTDKGECSQVNVVFKTEEFSI